MLTTILFLIAGGLICAFVFKIIFAILGFVLRLVGGALLLPFLIIGGILLLPLAIFGLGLGLIIKLLPIILLGGAGYFLYQKFAGQGKYWYK